MRVIVLHGEILDSSPDDEQDVLIQVDEVSRALEALGYEPVAVPFTMDVQKFTDTIRAVSPVFVFNLAESVEGQGQLAYLPAAIMDYLKVPYTGNPAEAVFVNCNKIFTKKLLKNAGIPTPPWITYDALKQGCGPAPNAPCILKMIHEHASIGLDEKSVVRDGEMITSQMDRWAGEKGSKIYAESFIDGREFSLSLISGNGGGRVVAPQEVCFTGYPPGKEKMIHYQAKWDLDSFEYHHIKRHFHFQPQDRPILDRLEEIALQCWSLLGLRGYARVDFRVDRQGNPYVIDLNTNPCLSPDSTFAYALNHTRMPFPEAIDLIIKGSIPGEVICRARQQEERNDEYQEFPFSMQDFLRQVMHVFGGSHSLEEEPSLTPL
jgi:D-alanine-D-alanine ligase